MLRSAVLFCAMLCRALPCIAHLPPPPPVPPPPPGPRRPRRRRRRRRRRQCSSRPQWDSEAVVLLLLGPTPSLPALAARGPRRAGRSGGRASGAASAAAASEAAPLRRNGPDHLSRGISEPRVWRMSQAKRPIPDNSETRVVRMSQAKRPGPPDFVEDVSALLSLGRS